MLWQGRRESSNIEDRRGMSGGSMAVGGGIGTMVIAFIVYLLGGNPNQVINQNTVQQQQSTQQSAPANDEATKFVGTILADTEDTWTTLFSKMNKTYTNPRLVLFNESTESACGAASQATGPFYCPGDSKVYLDVSFFNELKDRFGAAGDFADAYVIAHEVGHHVQHLLGITDQVDAQRGRISEREQNALSVRLELQADFFAGVWAHYEAQKKASDNTRSVIQEGDIEAALNAANAIGDDRLQKQTQGRVVPDAFTHGTSAQRMKWFKKGFDTGDVSQGDTFSATDL